MMLHRFSVAVGPLSHRENQTDTDHMLQERQIEFYQIVQITPYITLIKIN